MLSEAKHLAFEILRLTARDSGRQSSPLATSEWRLTASHRTIVGRLRMIVEF